LESLEDESSEGRSVGMVANKEVVLVKEDLALAFSLVLHIDLAVFLALLFACMGSVAIAFSLLLTLHLG
jgi:hypothetical protein